jgi:RimJ/RimL family protein N-acetyltransferase
MLYDLRKFNKNDVLDLYHALHDKRIIKHMATNGITKKTCECIIKDAMGHWDKYGYGSWAVIDQKTKRIVGWAGFKLWKEDEIELLCVLNPTYWGIGKSILYDLIKYAKNEIRLNRIFILLPHTRKSFKAIQKYGFVCCGEEVFNKEKFKKFKLGLCG